MHRRHRKWKSGEAEGLVQSKIGRLQRRLELMRRQRAEEAEAEARERLLHEAEELRDSRGRQIYGDAWDNPEAGEGAPLRDLFALSDGEVDLLRKQAAVIVNAKRDRGPPAPRVDFSQKALPRNPLRSAVAQFRASYNAAARRGDEKQDADDIHHRKETTTHDARRASPRVLPVCA